MTVASHLVLPTLDRELPMQLQERAAPGRSYTWHFSTQGLPSQTVTGLRRGLLPHIFTLTGQRLGGYFLWHFLVSPGGESRLFTGALPCAVQTFLMNVDSPDSAACSGAKLGK